MAWLLMVLTRFYHPGKNKINKGIHIKTFVNVRDFRVVDLIGLLIKIKQNRDECKITLFI